MQYIDIQQLELSMPNVRPSPPPPLPSPPLPSPPLPSLHRLELDAQDSQERTALHHACLEGHAKTVELLMDRGALDSCVDTQG